jgi:hypothetical protein
LQQLGQHIKTIHIGHTHIQESNIRHFPFSHFQGLMPVLSGEESMAQRFYHIKNDVP